MLDTTISTRNEGLAGSISCQQIYIVSFSEELGPFFIRLTKRISSILKEKNVGKKLDNSL